MGQSITLFPFLFSIISLISCQRLHPEGVCQPGDIVFVLDSSNSIWHSDFDLQLEFVRNVVDLLPIGSRAGDFRVGLVTYSHKVRLHFHLNYHTERPVLNRAIMRVPYLGGGTYTGDAIKYVYTRMFLRERGSRKQANHIMVVITDGLSQNTTATAIQASLARYHGARMFVVGVGPGVDQDELESIASNPDYKYLFRVDDFTGLDAIKQKLAHRTCEPSTQRDFGGSDHSRGDTGPDVVLPPRRPQNCGGKPAEVFFVVDASSSIWHPDFEKQLLFMKHIIKIFDIGPTRTRVGVIVFSDRIHPVIMLNTYEQKDDLLRAVTSVPYLTGGTDTAAAIKYLREVGFSKVVARQHVAHVGIILTDGQSQDVKATKQQALLAHREGVYLFSIGIGSNVDKTELRDIANDPDENFVFMLDNYDALTSIQDILAIKTCDVTPNQPPQRDSAVCSKAPNMDLVFGLDSNELRATETEQVIQLVQALVQNLDVSLENTHVGLVANDCPRPKDGRFSTHSTKESFSREMESLEIPTMSHLLHKLRHHSFAAKQNSRANVSRVAVVFVSGHLDKERQALREAYKLKRHGVQLFVVAVGDTASRYELSSMCSSPAERHLITVSSFKKLKDFRTDILRRLCNTQ